MQESVSPAALTGKSFAIAAIIAGTTMLAMS
jgi:hypothetical protein